MVAYNYYTHIRLTKFNATKYNIAQIQINMHEVIIFGK